MNFSELEKELSLVFKNKEILKTAFVHRSFLNENHDYTLSSNERLEFLGDAVLEFIVSKFLYEHFTEKKEGDLTAFRSALVCTETLSKISLKLGFGKYLFLSKGEEATGGRERPYILANTFEAFLGAIFLDSGIVKARDFVKRFLLPELNAIISNGSFKDAKSRLQEIAQEKVNVTPHYEVLSEEGPDHDKCFLVGVFLANKKIAEGRGKSKQKAEQKSAINALKKWSA